jgi:hypothetical protein
MATSTPQHPDSPAHDPVTQTLALLQPWIEYVPRQQRRLGLFIFLALLVHLAAFFFIRIDSTHAELQHQTRVHVALDYPRAVTANSESGDALWDRLTDPRLFLLPLDPLAGLASDEPPMALNNNLGSSELPPSAPPEDYRAALPAVTPLAQRVEEAMRPPRQPFAYDEKAAPIAKKTVVQWDNLLNLRQPSGVPDLPSPISDTDLSPTVLRVGVGPVGDVEHVLVEESSAGDQGATAAKDLDQQAILAARKIRFKPVDQPGIEWGRITVFWNYSAKPVEEVVPTPPTAP